MPSYSSIRIDDDLPSGHSGIACRTADIECARRIDEERRLVVQIISNNRLDDVFDDIFFDLIVGDIFGMLRRDDDGIDPYRRMAVIFDGDLRLAVRIDPMKDPRFPDMRKPPG